MYLCAKLLMVQEETSRKLFRVLQSDLQTKMSWTGLL